VLRDSGTGQAPRLKARTLRAGSNQGGSASGARPAQRPPSRSVHVNFSSGSARRPAPAKRSSRPVNLHLGSQTLRRDLPQGGGQRGGGMPANSLQPGTDRRDPAAGAAGRAVVGCPRGHAAGPANARPVQRPGRWPGRPGPAPSSRGPGSAAASCRVGRRAAPGALACGSMPPGASGAAAAGIWLKAARGAIGGSVLAAAAGAVARALGRCTPRFRGPRGVRAGRAPDATSCWVWTAVSSVRRRSWWRIFSKRSGGFK
jgi:hypothetical protein